MRSREEFKKEYCRKSGITEETFDENFIVVHCDCDEDICSGWAVIENSSESIKRFKEINGEHHESY